MVVDMTGWNTNQVDSFIKANAHQRQPVSASRVVDSTINREVDSIMNASPSPLVDSLLLRYNEEMKR